MTSPRYSNDKADLKDFLRSFVRVIPFACIALAVLSLQHVFEVAKFVSSPEFKMNKSALKIVSYFGNGGFLHPDLIRYGMVLCGIIMSVTLFRFILAKKSVNVYLSMGITRTRLYVNRIIAASLALLLAVVIPMGILLIINISSFGASQHVFDVFFYETCILFMSGLAGFSIATLASTFSGSTLEMVLNTFAISLIPSLISTSNMQIKQSLLKGYAGTYGGLSYVAEIFTGRAFSPWKFAVDLGVANAKGNNTAGAFIADPYFAMAEMVEKKVPENKLLDFGLMLPIIIWVVISAVLLALGWLLINKRKAENSNSFGRFYISSAVLGSTAYLMVGTILSMILGSVSASRTLRFIEGPNPLFHKTGLCTMIAIIILFIVFFVTELIVRRKIKSTVRMWPVFAGLVLLTVLTVIFFASGKFGTYNKAPKQSDVKEIALDIYDPQNNFATHVLNGKAYMSSDGKDIEFALEQFKKISASKTVDDRNSVWVTFKFVLNDKTVVLRRFEVFDSALFEEYMRAAFNTDYFKSNMKYLMLNEPKPESNVNREDTAVYADDYSAMTSYDNGEIYYEGMLRACNWYVASSDGIIDNKVVRKNGEETILDEVSLFDDTDALMQAVYNDLTKMKFDEIYMNTKRPVAILFTGAQPAKYSDEKYVIYSEGDRLYTSMRADEYARYYKNRTSSETKTLAAEPQSYQNIFYVYDNMTETLALLKEHGFDVNTHSAKVREVYYTDSKISPYKVMDQLRKNLSKSNKDYYYWQSSVFGDSIISGAFRSFDVFNIIIYTDYFGYVMGVDGEKSLTMSEMLNKIYDDTGHPLRKAASAEKAQEIAEKSVPFFCSYRDNGRYVFIVYEDNVISCRYIPSANIGVIG